MTFPHISVCAHLADTLPGNSGSEGESGDGDNGYNYIVDQQPLGAKLFKQFCLNHKKGMNNTLNDNSVFSRDNPSIYVFLGSYYIICFFSIILDTIF